MLKNMKQAIEFFENRKELGIKPGLDRINELLKLVDNPQDKVKAIHIAGTNGKGSTVNYMKSALIANGLQVGVFASPSLEGLTGHIFCNDDKITDDIFLKLLNDMYSAICELDETGNHPTEFEIITVLAFLYFSTDVDIALIEAGMGGREDTTNCFQPILSIITNVDIDHTAFLGETIEEISMHKAGIIKKNTPVITGEVKKDAILQIKQEAQLRNAPYYQLFEHFNYTHLKQTRKFQRFQWNHGETSREIEIAMYGEHQVKNSALALMALHLLTKSNIPLEWDKVLKGIRETHVPGRFELIRENPIIILDGAHNPAGIASFIHTVNTVFPNEERHLLFAGFKDKDLKEMLDQLSSYFTSVTLTTFDHERAASIDYLSTLSNDSSKYNVADWEETLRTIENSTNDEACYFITGSLHFIAEIRSYFSYTSM